MPSQEPCVTQNPTRLGHYVVIRDLGTGAHGTVKLVQHADSREYRAIKLIPRGEQVTKYAKQELLHLHQLAVHENIIQLQEVFLTEEHLCIVLEYALGGNLHAYVCKGGIINENDVRWFFWQLIKAVDYCHRLDICNRDIKLENLLLMDESRRPILKLCDFGFSKGADNSVPGSKVGTTHYMAPEVIMLRPGLTYDGKAADIWSCGVVLYTLLFRTHPFARLGDERFGWRAEHIVASRIQLGDFQIPTVFCSAGLPGPYTAYDISAELKDLVGRMLAYDADQRIKMQEIMGHPWFKYRMPARFQLMNRCMPKEQPAHLPRREEVRALLREAELCREEPVVDDLIPAELLNEEDDEDESGTGCVSAYVLAT